MKRAACLLSILLAVATLSACSDDGGGKPQEAAPPAPVATLADLLVVDELGIYQASKSTLVEAGELTKKQTPLVPGRPGLVRAHVKLKPVNPRPKLAPLVAELRIHTPSKPDLVLTDGPRSVLPYEEGDIQSTFNFRLDEAALATGASFELSFRDPEAPDVVAKFPNADIAETSTLPLPVGSVSTSLRVQMVPVRYDADGSGRLPDLSSPIVKEYRDNLYRTYPAAKVEMKVRDQLRWPLAVDPDGEGWDELLDALIETRYDDKAADDVYYVAVFDGAPSVREWCGRGCVLGIAPQAMLRDIGLRVAMIVGYEGAAAEGTLAQELAHAMGRAHAPCGGPAGIDTKYPYARANIGVFGWDLIAQELVDPESRIYDFMSYCGPTWVSDYTFTGLYERMVKVATSKRPEQPEQPTTGGAGGSERQRVRLYHERPDGTLRKGPMVEVARGALEDGEGRGIVVEDADKRVLTRARAAYRSVAFGGKSRGILLGPDVTTATSLSGGGRVRLDATF